LLSNNINVNDKPIRGLFCPYKSGFYQEKGEQNMTKNHNRNVLYISLATLGAISVAALAFGTTVLPLNADPASSSRHLAFSSSTPFVTGSDGVARSKSRYVNFIGGDVETTTGAFCTLKNSDTSYLRNEDCINELEKVSVTFSGTGSLEMGYSYYDALENDNLSIWSRETGDGGVVTLASGVATSVDLSACRFLYFVAVGSDITITSLDVQYGKNGCVVPSIKELPANLNKVFNATNRLNIELEAKDYSTALADYDADGTPESSYVIHLDQGKPTVKYGSNDKTAHDDANVYNDWLAANGVGDITPLSRVSTSTSYMDNVADAGGVTGKSYRRSVNFHVSGKGSSTILPEFIVNPYISYDWGAGAKIGDYNPVVGGEFHVGEATTDLAKNMFIMQYDVNLSFDNVTFKGKKGLEFAYGWTATSNSPEARTSASSENQIENDMGTDLGTIQKLSLSHCDFEINNTDSYATQAIDLKAFVGKKTNTYLNKDVEICRQGGTFIDNCHFNQVHDASNQSTAIYGNGFNNIQVTNSTFGDSAYDGSTNTKAIDFNSFQCSGYSVKGDTLFEGNTIYADKDRPIRFNNLDFGSDGKGSLTITGNQFTKGCLKGVTSKEGYAKFSQFDVLADAKAGIDHFRLGNDNTFADLSGSDITSDVVANRDNTKYFINAYVNYDSASKTHIAF
jgi:hypothetical protein